MLESFVKHELENPSPRKQVENSVIYASRLFGWPPAGEPVLCDFGSAEKGDVENTRNAGPDVYRAPEAMLEMPWSYSVDIWNVGVLVCYRPQSFRHKVNGMLTLQIWDLFEGRTLFSGQDPDGKGYSTRAHLAEMIGLLGQPPADFIKRGKRSPEFFDDEG